MVSLAEASIFVVAGAHSPVSNVAKKRLDFLTDSPLRKICLRPRLLFSKLIASFLQQDDDILSRWVMLEFQWLFEGRRIARR